MDLKVDKSAWYNYGTTKASNILHASEFAKRQDDGITSLSLNPDGIKRAYTELFARLASKNGAHSKILPSVLFDDTTK
ncbi:MAG: hypothetical protein Q9175_000961 [Cornicularia normoerica]